MSDFEVRNFLKYLRCTDLRSAAAVTLGLLLFLATFSEATDNSVRTDFDGDGKTDFAGGQYADGRLVWRIRRSTDGNIAEIVYFVDGDKPVPGDYDGDGKTDVAVFRQSDASWYIFRSSDSNWWVVRMGIPTELPLTEPNAF